MNQLTFDLANTHIQSTNSDNQPMSSNNQSINKLLNIRGMEYLIAVVFVV